MDLKAGEPGWEWFFEGFICFINLALLKQGGWALRPMPGPCSRTFPPPTRGGGIMGKFICTSN